MSATRWRNDAAECALLGCCVAEPLAFDAVRDEVAADDFHDATRGLVWEAIAAVRASGRAPTEAAIEDELERRARGRARLCGLPGAFAAWAAAAARTRDAHDAAAIVARHAAARRTIDALHDALAYAERGARDPEDLAAYAARVVGDASAGTGDARAIDVVEACEAFCADVEARRGRPGPKGVTSGIAPLDAIVQGFDPGLHLLAALTGVGKTTLAVNLATHVASLGRGSVLYVSLEMFAAKLVRRIVAGATGVNARAYRNADVTDAQWERTLRACAALSTLPLRLVDRTDLAASQVRALARREARRGPLALVVVDHVGLLAPERDGRREKTREREVAEQVWRLKVLANELRCPVLALVQLNRGPEQQQRRPRLSDLRESGSLEHAAESVLLLHRGRDGVVVCDVAKNRDDMTGECRLALDGATSTFRAAPALPPSAAPAALPAGDDAGADW